MKVKNIATSNYFKAITQLTFGSLIAQLITVLVSPISTRLYTPEQLGIYTLIITVSAMFGPVLAGKYDMAIVSAEDENEVNNLIVGSTYISILFILLITIGYHFYLNSKPEILNEVGLFAYLLIGILCLSAAVNILNYYNNRYKEYKLISSVYVVRTSFQNLGLVLFGFLRFGAIGLLLSQLLGSFAGLKKQSKRLYNNRSQFKEVNFKEVKNVLVKYKKQPLYAMPAHFINSTSYSILNFFITGLFGLSSFGYYSMSYRILGLPLSLVSMNVSKVFFQRASDEKHNKGTYNKTLIEITLFLLCLAIPMVLILVFLAPKLFELVFGDGWYVAGRYAQLLAPMYGVRFIVSALTPALVISGEQKLEVLIQSLFIICSIFSYFICKYMLLGIGTFLSIISLSYSIIYIFLYITIYKLSKKRIKDEKEF